MVNMEVIGGKTRDGRVGRERKGRGRPLLERQLRDRDGGKRNRSQYPHWMLRNRVCRGLFCTSCGLRCKIMRNHLQPCGVRLESRFIIFLHVYEAGSSRIVYL